MVVVAPESGDAAGAGALAEGALAGGALGAEAEPLAAPAVDGALWLAQPAVRISTAAVAATPLFFI